MFRKNASEGDSEERQLRLTESRALLKEASGALKTERLDKAFRFFTDAHDLGDDDVVCHVRGHWGRAQVEWRQRNLRAALLDCFFGSLALLVSPVRRLRGVRGRGFGPPA